MDLVDFIFYDLFPALLKLSDRVVSFFSTSVGDLITNALNVDLPDFAIFEFSLFSFMFGAGLATFVGYTLLKWFLDIIR